MVGSGGLKPGSIPLDNNYNMKNHFRNVLYNFTFPAEGVTSNLKYDRGGLTKYGVSSKSYPNLDIRSITRNGAAVIYYRDYWLKSKCNKLQPRLAQFIFDSAVNCGNSSAGKFLQRSVNSLTENSLLVDGIIGSITLSEVAKWDETEIILGVAAERLYYYTRIAGGDASQTHLLRGWVNRVAGLLEFVQRSVNQ